MSKVIELSEKCRQEAETLHSSGVYNCAEAVMESIRKAFLPEIPESVISTVSGFGGGSASGCICGAVSGGTVAIGMVSGNKKETLGMTGELHKWFKEEYGATCCKIIRQGQGKGFCSKISGDVAGKITEMLSNH